LGKKGKERRVYSKEFKAEASAPGERKEKPTSRIALDLGVNENILRRWIQQAREAAKGGGRTSPGAGGRGMRNWSVYGRKTRRCRRRKEAARLMRENGLNARGRWKFIIPAANSNHGFPVCGNLLNREFHAERDGEKWVSDSTHLRTLGGWVYLTVILDLYERKVSGWALSADIETVHTTIPAIETAFANRKAQEGLLFHSDRGVQYCAKSFRERLGELCPSVRRSMSRKGAVGTPPVQDRFSSP
jgi:transposase InsO family protein